MSFSLSGRPITIRKTLMAGLAKQMVELGWKATVIDTDYNAEGNEKGIPGLEALQDADLAVLLSKVSSTEARSVCTY